MYLVANYIHFVTFRYQNIQTKCDTEPREQLESERVGWNGLTKWTKVKLVPTQFCTQYVTTFATLSHLYDVGWANQRQVKTKINKSEFPPLYKCESVA